MNQLDQIKISKRNRMADIESAYLRAKEYEKSDHSTADRLLALEKIDRIVGSRVFLEQGAALQVIGRIQQVLSDLKVPADVITEYESLKKSLAEMNGKD